MNTLTSTAGPDAANRNWLGSPWLPIFATWLILFVPTYWKLADSIWQTDEDAHGAMILMILVWLCWTARARIFATPDRPRIAAGSACLGLGLLMYALGRSQSTLMLEIGSQIPVLAGMLLLLHGPSAVRVLRFALAYSIFMIPIPAVVVDNATAPLKQWISIIVEQLLYWAGYPVARSGVILQLDQYQLLVADACSGLHSMFSLAAPGVLYIYLMARRSWLHNAVMLAVILPFAFIANVARVLVLALITYHLGDAAGQGFLHGFAGIVLIFAATVGLLATDTILVRVLGGERA